jgi:hypothetical protein
MAILKQYVRDKKGNPKGLVLAVISDNPDAKVVRLGWSLCSKRDRFDKGIAENIAVGRAYEGTAALIPHAVEREFSYFHKRLSRFLKNEDYHVLVVR